MQFSMRVRSLELEHFCGYEHAVFDFDDRLNAFYGPNGCGKSTALEALRIIGNLNRITERENDLFFRKLTYHTDYDPSLPHFATSEQPLRVKAVFDVNGEEKVCEITSEGVIEGGDFDGIIRKETTGNNDILFVDADNQSNTQKFQLPDKAKEKFLEIAPIVYGYDVSLGKDVITEEGDVEEVYWQDVIIQKGKTRVHYKSMSAGEKKVATLLRSLCNPFLVRDAKILLVDNIEMHVYFERHGRMLDRILEVLPDKQFIVTTHSGDMLRHIRTSYGEQCLFNVPEIKGEPLNSESLL